MKVSIFYNWPLGKDSARVSLGIPNVEDVKYEFRVGYIDEQGQGGWLEPGWVGHDEIVKLDGFVKRNWKVRIEKRDKATEEIVLRQEIDCVKEWPTEAGGATSVDTGFWI